MQNLAFNQILDSNFAALIKLYPLLSENTESFIYAQIMKAYYKNDLEFLKAIHSQLEESHLKEFCYFRFRMVAGDLSKNEVLNSFKHSYSKDWKGEIEFCQGFALYRLKEYKLAMDYFHNSYISLSESKVDKKALLAFANAITMNGNIHPTKRQMADYHEVVKIGAKIDAYDVMANAMMNLSDEFYKMGALNSALEFINNCLDTLQSYQETHQSNEAKCMKAEILFALKRNTEAEKLMSQLEAIGNKETLEALKVIRFRHLGGDNNIDEKVLTPPWKSKLRKYFNIKELGGKSNDLVTILSYGPCSRDSLVKKLYGDIDRGDAENRITTLISRLNKVSNDLVIWSKETSSYRLSLNESFKEGYELS